MIASALVCLVLLFLFPKAFKFMVGTWVGVACGGFLWCLAGLVIPPLFTPGAFVAFIAAGIVGGWVLAAKG
jgi:hypothetical protein